MIEIPVVVMAEANLVARKAFLWRSREDERYWKQAYPDEGSLDKIIAYHDLDYGEAYDFASWAAKVVFRRHGFCCIEEVADIFWDDEVIIDPYPLKEQNGGSPH